MSDAEIRSFFETYKTSVRNKDIEALMSIYAEDIRSFDMWSVWLYEGLDEWREMNEKWFQSLGSNRDFVDFSDISVASNDGLGFASAIVTYSAVSEAGSVLRSMQTRLTWAAKKYPSDWKIFHQHTSAPIDENTIRAILTQG